MGDLQTVLEGLALRNGPLGEALAKRLAFEKLHDEEVPPGDLFE